MMPELKLMLALALWVGFLLAVAALLDRRAERRRLRAILSDPGPNRVVDEDEAVTLIAAGTDAESQPRLPREEVIE